MLIPRLYVGRFTQPDPIGIAGGINLYQYAPNTVHWIDPWRLATYPAVTFPSSQVIHETTIKMQGSRGKDFGVANANIGLNGVRGVPTQNAHMQQGYGDVTWHHADYNPATNEAKMQLIPRDIHEASYPHSGSVAEFEAHTQTKYETPEAKAAAIKMNSTISSGC